MVYHSTEKRAFNENQAADYIGMPVSYLQRGRIKHGNQTRIPAPQHVYIGHNVRYLLEDLDRWLDEQKMKMETIK